MKKKPPVFKCTPWDEDYKEEKFVLSGELEVSEDIEFISFILE